jgi:hypothetical protein
MKFGRRDRSGFPDDRTGSATTQFALGALAILLASLVVGDELARLGQKSGLPNIEVARNAAVFRGGQVDPTPTGSIPETFKGPGRTPCGERVD